jgi:protein-tyrosine phosphatase
MIDFHSHLVPAVDDGAASLDETRAALETFRAQGVHTVLTTPHLRGSVTVKPEDLAAFLAKVDAAWEEMRALAAAEFPEMRVERGFEVMLDTPAPDLSDPRVRLAGTRFVLVEFPFMSIPPNAGPALFELKMAGWKPVIAHPERYGNLDPSLREAAEWRRVGGLLQLNGGSLLGRYGKQEQALAWDLLKRGMASYLCSDYHARGRCSAQEARSAVERAMGEERARLLTETNPQRLLEGKSPLDVPPLEERRSFWGRLFGGSRR